MTVARCATRLNVVCFERMPLVAIGGESFAALLFAGFVGAYKFGDPWESTSECRDLIAEIDQQIARFNFAVA